MVQRVSGEEGMSFRLLSSGLVLGAGMLLASTFSAMAGEITGSVDSVDMENHTISVNGETIKVPEGMNVDGIVEAAPECLWAETHAHAGVTRDFFDAYFEGRDRAFAIQVGEVRLYDAPLVPGDVIANFTAPQSYMYVDDRLSRPAPEARQLALLK